MAKRKEKPKSFEDLLAFVEELVRDLEGGDLGLEEAMNRYSEGVKALSSCRLVLDEAEKKIEILIRSADGQMVPEPFNPEEVDETPPLQRGRRPPAKRIPKSPRGGRSAVLMVPFPATLEAFLSEIPLAVDEALSRLLPQSIGRNAPVVEAMRYTVFAGGKRFRPCLCLLACHSVGDDPFHAMDCACAFEFIHSYSLIHDDLPAMDNADLRRGRPSNHKAFGEAMAVLAGDGLLTLAFEVLGSSYPTRGSALVAELARGAGIEGMIAGQVADILGAGAAPTRDDVEAIHRGKTGALIASALRAGGIVGGGTDPELALLTKFGRDVGLAFQIVDDILDETQESSVIGKSAGSDLRAEKITYPAVFGLTESRSLAHSLTEEAVKAVDGLPRPDLLRDLARTIVRRMT